ncbi:MAG TPA: hypothetical protein VD994_17900 [Prosthecobacter sp.]|nr:hypothetical protein [Prosthecobacter sp.]
MKHGFNRFLCLLGALGSGGAAGLLAYRMATLDAPQWAVPCKVLAGFAVLAVIAALMRGGWLQKLISGGMKLALTTVITFGVAEVACRALKVDFNELLGMRRANESFPIYFRLPTHPSGDIFFTRPPGSFWTGKPLQTLLKNNRSTDAAYADEQELTVRYSKEGFRNPDDLADWDIVVTGDSFTESGYLSESAIFTGVAATQTGKRIKNLGVADTGNFAHTHYLETYGQAPSCRVAVLAFFEGNDLTDNVNELAALEKFKDSGERPSHEIPRQPSLLRAMWTLVRDFKKLKLKDRSYANAFFKSGNAETPVTIADAPPSSAQMTAAEKAALTAALDRFVAASQKHGMKPHLLYLPCKRRVLHGHLRQGTDYPQPDWQPGDLPQHIAEQCAQRGIAFIDATPSLSAAAAAGKPAFNTIYDTHFDAEGQRIVGEVLAQALKPSLEITSTSASPSETDRFRRR